MLWHRDDPILIVGMHRSGTTLLARQLAMLGVFMGHRRDENCESWAFLNLNDRVFELAHAAWDRPLGVAELLASETAMGAAADLLARETSSFRFRRHYLGNLGTLTSPLGLTHRAWGFKDPRSTFTWPLWTRLMPNARVVNIRRNGLDVAASLWRRARGQLDEQHVGPFALDRHHARFVSVRCADLQRAFDLWTEYVTGFDDLQKRFPHARTLDLAYEDLLEDPCKILERVCRFCELDVARRNIVRAADRVRSDRALAYKRDDELAELSLKTADHPLLANYTRRAEAE